LEDFVHVHVQIKEMGCIIAKEKKRLASADCISCWDLCPRAGHGCAEAAMGMWRAASAPAYAGGDEVLQWLDRVHGMKVAA
jgi:hypothetical protein